MNSSLAANSLKQTQQIEQTHLEHQQKLWVLSVFSVCRQKRGRWKLFFSKSRKVRSIFSLSWFIKDIAERFPSASINKVKNICKLLVTEPSQRTILWSRICNIWRVSIDFIEEFAIKIWLMITANLIAGITVIRVMRREFWMWYHRVFMCLSRTSFLHQPRWNGNLLRVERPRSAQS